MAHFAILDDNNVVLQVVVVANEDTANPEGQEVEQIGVEFLTSLFGPGNYVQTSYNHSMRKQYAGIGYTYHSGRNRFIQQKPYPSWTLDVDDDWQPPKTRPDGDNWQWDEENQEWVKL